MAELAVFDNDPTLYLYTSLTAGSSHIVTATSRIETILKANRIPFKGVDTATDELARKLFQRRARGKKLPLLVKEGFVIADLEQIEEWNEYDELKEALGGSAAPVPVKATPAPGATSATATTTSAANKKENDPPATSTPEQSLAIRQLGAEAAKVAAAKKNVPEKISTTNPLLTEKINSPAVGTPTKSADPSSILSPRSIPLPSTPNPASASATEASGSIAAVPNIPKIEQKPVHSPPSMHVDAENPELAAAPTSSTRPSPSPLPSGTPGSGSGMTSYHGRSMSSPGAEEVKRVEKELSIAEVSQSDEEDDEDGKADTTKPKEAVKDGKTEDAEDGKVETTKPKDVVKDGKPETAKEDKKEDAAAEDEDDDEDDEDEDDESEKQTEGSEKKEEVLAPHTSRPLSVLVKEPRPEDLKKEVTIDTLMEELMENKPPKTQEQGAKDADKAGVSVED